MGNSQAISNRSSSAVTVQDARLFAQYNFRPPAFRDTTDANTNLGLDSCGALIFTRTTNTYWLRSCTPKKWVLVGSGSNVASYITTTQINDTSYYITRSDGTKDTFLFTGGGTASGQYIDSLKRSSDSVYGRINNVFRFQYKDSTGGGGVSSVGSGYGIANSPTTITSTGSVIVDTSSLGLSGKYLRIVDTTAMLTPYLRKIDSSRWVSSITRTPGKDSIIFFKNGDRFAIKDSVGTNPPASGYYGAFSDTLTQSITSTTLAYPMFFRITDTSNGISVQGGNRIVFANTGIYNVQFSVQLQNTDNSLHDVRIWLKKNGTDIVGSTGFVSVPNSHGGGDGHILPSWNFVLGMVAGDSLVWYWTATSTQVTIQKYPIGSSPTTPSTASTVLTVTQQAGILAGTGITAINSLTGGAQTMVVDSSNSTFKITSTGTSHTFNIPNASTSGVTRGLLSNTDYTTFNGKVPYTGATGDVNLGTHNIIVNNVDARTTTLTTSNQTIQLTLDSSFIQLATGTTSNIFYNLPNATTLNVGASFQFNNNTTSGAISVRNFGVVNTIATIPAGGAVQVVLLSNTTTTGTWDVLNYGPKNASWGTDSLSATSTKAKFSSLVLGTPLTVANGGADSTTYYTKYRSDTSRTNIYSGINGKLGTSDTAAMLAPYLRKTDTASLSSRINLKLAISDTAAMLAPYTRQRDTIPMFVFGAGSGAAGDTSAFSTSALYGSFYNSGSDTILVTSLQIGLQGTSPSINATVYFNDSLAVTAGATKLVNAGNTATNIYTGTTVSSFDNTKIPPGNWVWVQTGTVTTKPTFFVLTLIGYKIRR